ncbi:MAG: hypothetical protein HYV29_01670 [Ignavibacteriales bacterium]|nr:hypothetical protein [Ignavibacteriales bacterium]
MHPALIVGIVMLAATLYAIFGAHHLHGKDEEMSQDLADSKRLDQLRSEAMRLFPAESELVALSKYRQENTLFIQTLKQNDGKADVLEALKFSLRDQRILSQEIARLFRIEIYNESQFNKLTAAQA